jgi:hypothetical protein
VSEVARAEQLCELLVAALQSHQRLTAVEREFQDKLKDYWAHVQQNVDHGVELARLEWEKDARNYERTNAHLDRENNSLDRKNRRLLVRLEKARAEIAGLKALNHGLRHKARAKAKR